MFTENVLGAVNNMKVLLQSQDDHTMVKMLVLSKQNYVIIDHANLLNPFL